MHVHLLTCGEMPDLYSDDRILLAELRRRDHTVSVGVWGDPMPAHAAVAVVRSCWDYHLHPTEFLRHLEATEAPVWNRPRLLRWNSDKAYLADLADSGCRIVPTAFDKSAGRLSGDTLVVKPRLSNAGQKVLLFDRANFTPEALAFAYGERPVLVQEFMAEVATEGEYSVIYLGGTYSHCVHKLPGRGDFRVQHFYGGTYRLCDPGLDLLREAKAVMEAVPGRTLYARLDFLTKGGSYHLSEAELIEPLLHFELCPEAAWRTALAVEALPPVSRYPAIAG